MMTMTSSSSSATAAVPVVDRPAISYRNAKEDDLDTIATLLTDCFDGPFAWYQAVPRKIAILQMRSQLADRFFRYVLQRRKHAMLVAVHEDQVIAFLELGTMPCPVIRNGTTEHAEEEVPFLGNIAVLEGFRRLKIASKLLKLAYKVAEKWQDKEIFVAVESNNEAALKLYQRAGFTIELDERELIDPPSSVKVPRIFLSIPIRAKEELVVSEPSSPVITS